MALAAQVSDVSKTYGQKTILKDFNFSLQEGTIYTLLGASGSGKTTILSLILGLIRVDQGQVLVYNKPPGDRSNGIPGPRLGFMPQGTGLHKEFTILETFYFFGRLYDMSSKAIKEQSAIMSELLELPEPSHLVSNCSGGQRRRLSLAVALMHRPDLLVLDEPTVGVDPILRQKIWEFLKSLTINSKKTILVTTHFMGETSFADKVGFLRQGKLIAEDTQTNLMRQYQINSIDELFLELSKKSERESNCEAIPVIVPTTTVGKSYLQQQEYKRESNFFNQLWALILMNFIKMKHNPIFLLLMVVLPILEMSSFCSSIGKEPKGLIIGVLNEESCLDFSMTECDYETFSCRILRHLETHQDLFYLQEYQNESEIKDDLQNAQILGYFRFPSNFSSALTKRIFGLETSEHGDYSDYYFASDEDYFVGTLSLNDSALPPLSSSSPNSWQGHLDIDEDTLNQSRIEVKLDESTYPLIVPLIDTIFDEMQTFFKDFMITCDLQDYLVRLPYILEDPVTKIEENSGATAFRTFMAPGFINILIFVLSVTLTGPTFIEGQLVNQTSNDCQFCFYKRSLFLDNRMEHWCGHGLQVRRTFKLFLDFCVPI